MDWRQKYASKLISMDEAVRKYTVEIFLPAA